MPHRAPWKALCVMLALFAINGPAAGKDPSGVDIADKRLVVVTSKGSGLLPVFLSPDWTTQTWKDGEPALGPVALSSFEAVDAVLARLADRTIFPNLVQVVVAGHSAGGQIVQRYTIVGTGSNKLTALGVRVRYVVANPSSDAYFTEDRPFPTTDCPTFDNWKYGMKKRPAYAANTAPVDFERTYAEREVVYLLGSDDTNAQAEDLDKRCEAEVQGKFRRARGEAYFAYMQNRHPTLRHRLQLVPGVGHRARQMFTSTLGVGILFDRPSREK
jgi:pimeloyl-ACP methyl ester carboxylesterase